MQGVMDPTFQPVEELIIRGHKRNKIDNVVWSWSSCEQVASNEKGLPLDFWIGYKP
jgi:hypothetical protein